METSRLMLFIIGNMKAKQDQGTRKQNPPRFYQDSDENDHGETIFCKNNVCVFNGEHIPGYLTLKACTINNEYTRLILHWTSNALLEESYVTDDQIRPMTSCEDDESTPRVFHIDLTEMKTLKFFFKEDKTSGHFVVGNHENHYKVFHFDLGGMNHLVEIFENWSLCKQMRLPVEERARKTAFAVVPVYSIMPNQSFEESRYYPMTKARWKTFFNKTGQLEDVPNFRKEVFFGGVFPEVRHEVWPFLLHYYPFHSRASDRESIREKKMKEYLDLSQKRLNMPKTEYDKFWLNVQCTVDKDVVRTDRSHPYFAGNDNPNVEILRQILLNYAYYQPEVGYSQGMSDLLASILSTVQDEVDAFWCFVGLMERSLFVTSPNDDSMDCQLLYLKELLRMMAARFYAHLVLEDENMDLLFCHRWLLLGFKREFHDLHALRMWEACWSHYQTEFFHIFICVAIVLEYGDPVWQKSMRVDEMLNYFNNLALEMDGGRVLKQARSLLYQFRRLAGIPCTLRGLLSGPGAWDSATLPEIECTCHETRTCKYLNLSARGKSFSPENKEISEKQHDDQKISEVKKGPEADNKLSGDEIKTQQETKDNELNSAGQKNKAESNSNEKHNGCSEELESSESERQELKSDELDKKELHEEELINSNDEIQQENETTTLKDKSSNEVQDTSALNHKSNDDLSSEKQQTNEKILLKDDRREGTDDLNKQTSDHLHSDIQQNIKENTDLEDKIPNQEQKLNDSNSKGDKQGLELNPEEQ